MPDTSDGQRAARRELEKYRGPQANVSRCDRQRGDGWVFRKGRPIGKANWREGGRDTVASTTS